MEDERDSAHNLRSAGSDPSGPTSGFQLGAKLRARMEKFEKWRIHPDSIKSPEDAREFHGGNATVSKAILSASIRLKDILQSFRQVPEFDVHTRGGTDHRRDGEDHWQDDEDHWQDDEDHRRDDEGGIDELCSEKFVAVKKARMGDNKDPERVLGLALREMEFLVELFHPNIVKLEGFVEHLSKDIIWLIFPWADNGNLRDFLASEEWGIPIRISLLKDVAGGLEYLHSRKPPICHGDLKSLNVLVNSKHVAVITDFGSARRLTEQDLNRRPAVVPNQQQLLQARFSTLSKTLTLTGHIYTLRWAAPELLTDDLMSLPSDIWAWGWTAFEVFTDSIPFQDVPTDVVVIERVIKGDLPSMDKHAHVAFFQNLCSLMTECWNSDPSTRPTAKACLDAISDMRTWFAPFFIREDRLEFKRTKSLGQGGFGLVKKATLLPADGSPGVPITVAVKILKADDWNAGPLQVASRVAREMLEWSSWDHEHIIKFIGYSRSKDETKAYLVSPFIKNGNIQHYLSYNAVSLQRRLEFVRDTLEGLQYLHSRKPPIVHGGLKSLNVLVNDNLRAVLCDFGLSAAMEGRKAELTTAINFKGSPRWCSPEALLETGTTLKSDIWSWGCLALEIMTGKPPYNDIKNEMNLVRRIGGPIGTRIKPEPGRLSSFPSGLLGLLWRCWEYNPERRPDVFTCVSIDRSIQIQAKGAPEWDTRWMDEWIMKFIPEFEIAVGECIYLAARDPNMARNLCCVASLSTAELELDFREAADLLDLDRGGKRLSRAATDYFFLRKAVIKSELQRRAQSVTRVVSQRRQDPVSQILHIFTLLRDRATLTRVRLGECLRELHSLLNTVIAPLDPGNDQLASNLSAFGALVRRYPDDSHDPEATNFLMDVYYAHHIRLGNYRLGFDVALQAAQRYRHFSEGDRNQTQNFSPRLADALDKTADCAEFLHEDETARPLLQEAIKVYRKLGDVNSQGEQIQIHETKVLLARTLVRYYRVVCRLDKELAVHWKRGAMDALREAIEIYDTARSFGQSERAKYGEELKAALIDLLAMARRREDKEEVAEVEARLRRLREEEQD